MKLDHFQDHGWPYALSITASKSLILLRAFPLMKWRATSGHCSLGTFRLAHVAATAVSHLSIVRSWFGPLKTGGNILSGHDSTNFATGDSGAIFDLIAEIILRCCRPGRKASEGGRRVCEESVHFIYAQPCLCLIISAWQMTKSVRNAIVLATVACACDRIHCSFVSSSRLLASCRSQITISQGPRRDRCRI